MPCLRHVGGVTRRHTDCGHSRTGDCGSIDVRQGGGPVAESVRRDTTGAFPLTIAEYSGTYARGTGAGSSADAARPGHMLIAIVAETPRGTLFFQCFGPAAAVDAQRNAYLQFVRGLR